MKNRVTGIGGLFFKTKDPKASKNWYKKHLGFNTDDYGCTFWWKDKDGKDCSTQWSPFPEDTKYYEPSKKDFMFNYSDMEEYEYGKFGWILDNDGNKIELWEPIDKAFE